MGWSGWRDWPLGFPKLQISDPGSDLPKVTGHYTKKERESLTAVQNSESLSPSCLGRAAGTASRLSASLSNALIQARLICMLSSPCPLSKWVTGEDTASKRAASPQLGLSTGQNLQHDVDMGRPRTEPPAKTCPHVGGMWRQHPLPVNAEVSPPRCLSPLHMPRLSPRHTGPPPHAPNTRERLGLHGLPRAFHSLAWLPEPLGSLSTNQNLARGTRAARGMCQRVASDF